MKVLNCEQTSISIRLPPCAGDDPVAEIQRANYTTVPLVRTQATLDAELFEFTFPSPFPADIPFPARGVWRLTATTGCGCYETDVYVDCPRPQMESVHTPSTTSGPSTECCEPEGAIHVSITSLDPPLVEIDDYPLATLLVDLNGAYALNLGIAELGGYQWYDRNGFLLAEGLFGLSGVTAFHDIDLTCTEYFLTRTP